MNLTYLPNHGILINWRESFQTFACSLKNRYIKKMIKKRINKDLRTIK